MCMSVVAHVHVQCTCTSTCKIIIFEFSIHRSKYIDLVQELYSSFNLDVMHVGEWENHAKVHIYLHFCGVHVHIYHLLTLWLMFTLESDRCKSCGGAKVVRDRKILEVNCNILQCISV